nr:hypothetical protein [Nocardia miyunensis]
MHDNLIAEGVAANVICELDDLPADFVPEHGARGHHRLTRGPHVNVGLAHTGGDDSQQRMTGFELGPVDFGERYILDTGVLDGTHSRLLSVERLDKAWII